ncbi:CPBP family glutamic-type intramembrane protease [Flavobacterium branchiarum]|uniref:Type II CAAX prenyl endopeptidase Rce1 family protein n=1 Tax=Flavobacterium branchiarum TaxID=1114870 RepID=A0ABV5FPI3_9FLAO|nr:CPBP family glutamic-type intramembrane protease [Flavobacterium branchiarum]MDN3675513.1 CPBP family glutamic-type intramembrane protease [Flavobacterium branchiarum]
MIYKSEVLSKKNIAYLFIYLILALVFILGIELVRYLLDIKDPDSNKLKDAFLSNFTFAFFSAVILSPIIEEVGFRLSLKRNKHYWLSIVFCLVFLLSTNFMVTKIICLLYIGITILHQFNNKTNLIKDIAIVLSVLTFLCVHFDNYNENELRALGSLDLLMLFLPQFVIGLIITKIRLQTCFLNSIIFHSFYNFFILSLALLFNY